MEPQFSRNYLSEFLRILTPSGHLVFQQPTGRKAEGEKRKPVTRLKQLVRSVMPKAVLHSYYYLKGLEIEEEPANAPKMEMHGINRQEMIQFLEANGGRILQVLPNQIAGPHWISLRYYVTKNVG